jgi:hypothetical protein
VLLRSDELDKLTRRTIAELRHLTPFQRDVVVERILGADPELRPVLPELLAVYRTRKYARRLGPLIRDSIS